MITEVLPNLYLGAWPDQMIFSGGILNVLEQAPERAHSLWVPILREESWMTYEGMNLHATDEEAIQRVMVRQPENIRASEGALMLAADIIERFHTQARPLLVHCGAGIERSPLAIAFWMVHRPNSGMTLDGAYGMLMTLRPIVMDRREWLPAHWRR